MTQDLNNNEITASYKLDNGDSYEVRKLQYKTESSEITESLEITENIAKIFNFLKDNNAALSMHITDKNNEKPYIFNLGNNELVELYRQYEDDVISYYYFQEKIDDKPLKYTTFLTNKNYYDTYCYRLSLYTKHDSTLSKKEIMEFLLEAKNCIQNDVYSLTVKRDNKTYVSHNIYNYGEHDFLDRTIKGIADKDDLEKTFDSIKEWKYLSLD